MLHRPTVDLSLPHTLQCHIQAAFTYVLSHIYPQTASKASPKYLTNPILPSPPTLLQTVLGEQTPLGTASFHFPSQLADMWVLSAWHKSPRLSSATPMPLALYSNKSFSKNFRKLAAGFHAHYITLPSNITLRVMFSLGCGLSDQFSATTQCNNKHIFLFIKKNLTLHKFSNCITVKCIYCVCKTLG
jgi:hypothetical protein